MNEIFSEGTSAQDQSEGNLAVVQNVFNGAAELAESGNVSYSESVSVATVYIYIFTLLFPEVISSLASASMHDTLCITQILFGFSGVIC